MLLTGPGRVVKTDGKNMGLYLKTNSLETTSVPSPEAHPFISPSSYAME